MTPTSVGMRCPVCAGEKTKVKKVPRRSPQHSYASAQFSWMDPSTWTVTGTLITINVLVFLAEVSTGVTLGGSKLAGWVYYHGVLYPPFLANGLDEYWRLFTSGFLHAGIIHIAMNMLSLWFVGRVLEPSIGKAYFAAIYFTSLLAGSFGAVLLSPNVPTLGASGAIFGIFGALIVVAHERRIPLWQSGLMPILILNFIFTLTVANVSLGGHLFGVLAGFATGWLVVHYGERLNRQAIVMAGCAALSAVAVIGAIAVAAAQSVPY